MQRFRRFCRQLAGPMALVVALTSMPLGNLQARMVTTDEILAENYGAINGDHAGIAERERERLAAFVAREDVRSQLESFGVPPEEAAARIAALSNSEVIQVAGHIDEEPAGQGAVVLILVVVLLVVVFWQVMD